MRVVHNNKIKLKRAIEEIGGVSCTIIKIGESLPYDISNSIKIKIPRIELFTIRYYKLSDKHSDMKIRDQLLIIGSGKHIKRMKTKKTF